jgi:uncharacterized protein
MARFEFATRDIVEYAAEGGAADALFQLGLMYCAGREVPIDFISAHKWFNLAAQRGNVEARRYRLELASEMSKQDVAIAQREARKWLAAH